MVPAPVLNELPARHDPSQSAGMIEDSFKGTGHVVRKAGTGFRCIKCFVFKPFRHHTHFFLLPCSACPRDGPDDLMADTMVCGAECVAGGSEELGGEGGQTLVSRATKSEMTRSNRREARNILCANRRLAESSVLRSVIQHTTDPVAEVFHENLDSLPPVPLWVQKISRTHRLAWTAGVISCKHCGGTCTGGRVRLLASTCKNRIAEGSKAQLDRLTMGRLPVHLPD